MPQWGTDLISSPDVAFLSTRYVDLLGNLRPSRSATARPTIPGDNQIRGNPVTGGLLTCSNDQMINSALRGLEGVVFGMIRLRVPPKAHLILVPRSRVEVRFDRSHQSESVAVVGTNALGISAGTVGWRPTTGPKAD